MASCSSVRTKPGSSRVTSSTSTAGTPPTDPVRAQLLRPTPDQRAIHIKRRSPMANVVKKNSISSELAQKMVDQAVAKATKIGVPENVASLGDARKLKT